MATIHLTSEQFIARVADYRSNPGVFDFLGDKPALIDFYAQWCGPCKMLAPVLEELSDEFAGRIDVYKINVDEEIELAQAFSVVSIPMLVVLKDGKVAEKSIGVRSKDDILDMLSR